MSSAVIDRLDGLSSTVAYKGPCRLASAVHVPLNGLRVINGVQTMSGDRVLLMGQNVASENGVYVTDTGNWRRTADFNKTGDVVKGTRVWVTEGDTGPAELEVTSENPVAVGVSDIDFTLSMSNANASAYLAVLNEFRSRYLGAYANDTAATAAAGTPTEGQMIELALASKKYVELPDLEIFVGSGIVFPATHRRLIGHGQRKTTLKVATASGSVITLPNGLTYCDVSGMTIDRTVAANATGHGLSTQGSVNLLNFYDLEILNQYRGMDLRSTGFSTIRDYFIHDCYSQGIYMTNTPAPAPSVIQWYIGHGLLQANSGGQDARQQLRHFPG